MAIRFVLDAPEFRPIVEAAQRRAEVSVKGPTAGYYSLSTDQDLRIERDETGLTEALWFGAVTGGYDGRSMALDSHTLLIRSTGTASR